MFVHEKLRPPIDLWTLIEWLKLFDNIGEQVWCMVPTTSADDGLWQGDGPPTPGSRSIIKPDRLHCSCKQTLGRLADFFWEVGPKKIASAMSICAPHLHQPVND